METIKVNMNPNPLDVQTIHASQNDTEARQWEFELHNNGELIDTSDVTDQIVFKAYKGGTEQILPENTSTPTTSPFKGDIRYPQGLLTDQEFTYRQSPTESDGLAKITDIKGNTLNWNQIYNVNSNRTTFGVNIKVVNGAVSITGTSTNVGTGPAFAWTDFKCVLGHKYIITKDFTLPAGDYIFDQYNLNSSTDITTVVFTVTNSGEYIIPQLRVAQSDVTYNISGHLCVFDLTKMFGAGNEPTTVEEFTSLFPLPYYSYNQGTLLSFNGNGLKTVGFNQWDEEWEVGAVNSANGANESASDRIRSKGYIRCLPNTAYYYVANNANLRIIFYDANKAYISYLNYSEPHLFTTPSGCCYMRFNSNAAYGNTYNNDICINISNTELNGTYEPYTSSTLSLPISAYFPNGMKSAGSVYDELTPIKAITRIGVVDLGTLNWTYNANYGMYTGGLIDVIKKPSTAQTKANVLCANRTTATWSQVFNSGKESGLCGVADSGHFGYSTTETNPSTFKQSMSGVYLYYELATPTETSFTTASLVTENGEIPLSNEDGVLIGKCTEQLSAEPGFHNAKIKLSDSDGDVYSNKIQLHVERSPQ